VAISEILYIGPAAEDRGCGCLHAGEQASQAAVLLIWLLAAVAV